MSYLSFLTDIGPTQSPAHGPGSEVRQLVVDGQALNAADEATVGPRGPDQPVSRRGPAHVERRPESDFAVLTLEEKGFLISDF